MTSVRGPEGTSAGVNEQTSFFSVVSSGAHQALSSAGAGDGIAEGAAAGVGESASAELANALVTKSAAARARRRRIHLVYHGPAVGRRKDQLNSPAFARAIQELISLSMMAS